MKEIATSRGSGVLPRHRNSRGQGAQLRAEIIEAASALLAESGDIRQLSLRGVAKRVGIAATSVYLHFPDTTHLAAAVAERRFTELAKVTAAAEEGIADPAVVLLARCRAYGHFALDHPGHYQVMFQIDPGVHDFAQSPARDALAGLVQAVARCVEARVARPHDDPFRLATLVWVALHGLVLARISRPWFPWAPLDEMVDETVGYIVGLGGRGE